MLDVVAPLDAEGHAACGVECEEAARDAYAPLVPRALVLQPRRLLLLRLAVGALEHHRLPLPVQPRHSDELPLLLRDQEL